MKAPLSWIKEYVDIHLPLVELAHLMTMAGLEVEEIHYVGLPLPGEIAPGQPPAGYGTKITGLEWDRQTIVVGAILEVMPHPNADRLVLCRLDDGNQVHTVLTGAPNLFAYKGQGPLEFPLKVAYAKEGARIYDGHQNGQVLTTLKRARIRGVDSYSMACSEKELGISDEHGGIIILAEDAPVGLPLADYMGDAVLDIVITPNIARAANIYGVAREIAALTGQKLRPAALGVSMQGPPIAGRAHLEIQQPELNPRFVLGLVENVTIRPSPYEVQRRLRLAGMRPINNIVDATNYAMLELGEPLHAFDYDVLVRRAGGAAPTILTRTAAAGEHLVTLDGIEHELDDFTVLVCDNAGALSIAGVMGGAASEVSDQTRNVLLEGAAWNFINIRRTLAAQHMSSEAAYRFSRGVHPALAEHGVLRGLELMRRWSDGLVLHGLIDAYPLPPQEPVVEITVDEVPRWLGISLPIQEIVRILTALEFKCEVIEEPGSPSRIRAKTPAHRMDIGDAIVGKADLMEEIARIHGYERLPETRLADALPPQVGNPYLELEDRLRNLLINCGLQEVMTYRMTSPEREARWSPDGLQSQEPYLWLANPIASDRVVMRRSLPSSLMEVVEQNARLQTRQALFEIGPVYWPKAGELLPDEPQRLVIVLTGVRTLPSWQVHDSGNLDFYDLKGIIASLLDGLHLTEVSYLPLDSGTTVPQEAAFHPGKAARVLLSGEPVGVLGELHPLVQARYDLPAGAAPILLAEFDVAAILKRVGVRYPIRPVPVYPPVLEDLALLVDETIPAERVAETIRQAGGERVIDVRLFDVYRGEQIGAGMKSLAYSLTYQAPDRTLTDAEVAQIRQRIIRQLEDGLGVKLRS
jgi:phenylalanyl-tRNA synthetase beta chain